MKLDSYQDFAGCVEQLGVDIASLQAELQTKTEGADVVAMTRFLVQLRTLSEQVEATTKPFNDLYNEFKDVRVPKAFEDAGVPTVNLDEGFRVTVSHKVRASVKGGMKEQALQWLRDNGLGDIVSETVNSSTLSAVARTMVEENRELDADLFSVHIMPTTSVTKVK